MFSNTLSCCWIPCLYHIFHSMCFLIGFKHPDHKPTFLPLMHHIQPFGNLELFPIRVTYCWNKRLYILLCLVYDNFKSLISLSFELNLSLHFFSVININLRNDGSDDEIYSPLKNHIPFGHCPWGKWFSLGTK